MFFSIMYTFYRILFLYSTVALFGVIKDWLISWYLIVVSLCKFSLVVNNATGYSLQVIAFEPNMGAQNADLKLQLAKFRRSDATGPIGVYAYGAIVCVFIHWTYLKSTIRTALFYEKKLIFTFNCSVCFYSFTVATVKPEIFAYPLFRKFRNLSKFAKITGRQYSNGNQLLSTSLIEPNTKLTLY